MVRRRDVAQEFDLADGNQDIEEDRHRTMADSDDKDMVDVSDEDSAAQDTVGSLEANRIHERADRGVPMSQQSMGAAESARRKRKYTYHVRKKASEESKQPSLRRRKWAELANAPGNPFDKKRFCCRRRQCFKFVDRVFAHAQYKRYLLMGKEQRKRELIALLDSDRKTFRFNGRIVCSRFLTKSFKFSSGMQSDVKGTPLARSSASVRAGPRQVLRRTLSDEIVVFLRRLSSAFGDNMPHNSNVHIPMLTKLEAYEEFCEQFVRRHGGERKVPAKSYFHAVWKRDCSNIKTYRYSGLTLCSKCEMTRSKLAESVHDERAQEVYRNEWKEHLAMVRGERRGYEYRIRLAVQQPNEYCSIILDGADQKCYGLPHFRISTKSDRGHKIKVKCVGALEHLPSNALTLYTMTENFKSGANHVIEVAHRVLHARKLKSGKLPKTLFVQVDNTVRENKNRFFFAYFEMLVARGVFMEVQVSFLPVGHTHADIDQAFSVVAGRLRHTDAHTMTDLLSHLRRCLGSSTIAERLDSVANFSGLCDQTNCLSNVQNITEYRFFKFTRNEGENSNGFFETSCAVKKTEDGDWNPLPVAPMRVGGSRTPKGFLLFVPSLQSMPSTRTRVPNNVAEINRCLFSIEERLRSENKFQQLLELRNDVYTERVDECSWDFTHTFELNGNYRTDADQMEDEELGNGAPGDQVDDLSYAPGDFVAVKSSQDTFSPFWIAQVKRISATDGRGRPAKLFIQWYIPDENARDPFTAVYVRATRKVKEKNRTTGKVEEREVLFTVHIDVRTVMVTFYSLSTTDRLTHTTRVALRSALNM